MMMIMITLIMLIPLSVNKNIPPETRHLGSLVSIAPNQGLDSSFGCCVARQTLAQKECLFTDTGTNRNAYMNNNLDSGSGPVTSPLLSSRYIRSLVKVILNS